MLHIFVLCTYILTFQRTFFTNTKKNMNRLDIL